MSYLGNPPGARSSTTIKDTFNGDGSTTQFTMTQAGTAINLDVFVENVRQEPNVAYTCDGKVVAFVSAPVTGTGNIYVINRGPTEVVAASDGGSGGITTGKAIAMAMVFG